MYFRASITASVVKGHRNGGSSNGRGVDPGEVRSCERPPKWWFKQLEERLLVRFFIVVKGHRNGGSSNAAASSTPPYRYCAGGSRNNFALTGKVASSFLIHDVSKTRNEKELICRFRQKEWVQRPSACFLGPPSLRTCGC